MASDACFHASVLVVFNTKISFSSSQTSKTLEKNWSLCLEGKDVETLGKMSNSVGYCGCLFVSSFLCIVFHLRGCGAILKNPYCGSWCPVSKTVQTLVDTHYHVGNSFTLLLHRIPCSKTPDLPECIYCKYPLVPF